MDYILKLNDEDIDEIIGALYLVVDCRCIGDKEDAKVMKVIDKINSQIDNQ